MGIREFMKLLSGATQLSVDHEKLATLLSSQFIVSVSLLHGMANDHPLYKDNHIVRTLRDAARQRMAGCTSAGKDQ